MSDFYTPAQQALQQQFETKQLADRLESTIVLAELPPQHAEFVSQQNMFFLSTVDQYGFPSCSYKGGAKGFVKVLNEKVIEFPNYDGNGMFMSQGNIVDCAKVGMLFINFETPHRVRLRGTAELITDGSAVDRHPGAQTITRVEIDKVWVNCPRYIHKFAPVASSKFIPLPNGTTTFAPWKRLSVFQDVINDTDRAEAESLGILSPEEYVAMISEDS
jgi:predicted pyridoxine 5'-phosphate oxidase superfamily flavin-nucleotide-binding protein